MAEATQLDTERENLIAEMLRDAKTTEIPSDLISNPVVHKGDGEQPAPMVVSKISNAGYVYVWDSRTFEKVPVLYYMLGQVLRQRRKDGSYRFTVRNPNEPPKRGTFKCLLHAEDPNRKRYDELGFPVCPADHMPSSHQVKLHMQKKHKAEWAAIEDEKKDRERQEDREFQKMLITKASPASPRGEIKVKRAKKK